jgi:hypothetical protein
MSESKNVEIVDGSGGRGGDVAEGEPHCGIERTESYPTLQFYEQKYGEFTQVARSVTTKGVGFNRLETADSAARVGFNRLETADSHARVGFNRLETADVRSTGVHTDTEERQTTGFTSTGNIIIA